MHSVKQFLIRIYEWAYEKRRLFILRLFYSLRIMSPVATIKYIKRSGCNISRFGDGEFDLIRKTRDLHFQNQSDEIAKKLSQVLASKNNALLICVPRCFNTVKGCDDHSREFWISWGKKDEHHKKIITLIRSFTGKHYRFGDAQITRPYIDWKTSSRADKTFPMLKSIWKGKDILIVEGAQTRMGVGNDLFDGAKSVKRILTPAENAFDKYDEIKQAILDNRGNRLILMAIGPTATILACDFAEMGIHALDIGNIDIEYEWYLRKASTRIPIPGKYTNEAKDGRVFTECTDKKYLSEIITEIR